MNVLLISVQANFDVIGLKTLHHYLLKNGHNSSILYLPYFHRNDNVALENIKDFVSELSPELIGISLMSNEFFQARDLTKYLKNNFSSPPIVWGGIHPTISPESCLDFADYVCIGEGEGTILDMANAINNGNGIKNINNLCYFENGEMKRNPLYPIIENLDDVSPYGYILTNSFIQENNSGVQVLNEILFRKNARYSGTYYSIITSRGCPFSCTYCCNNFLANLYNTRKIRRRSIDNIISELEKAVQDNPEIEYVNIHDDCFLACSGKHLEKFCQSYQKNIHRPIVVRCIPTFITRDKVRMLKNAGLAWVNLGLQSGSDRVCKEIYQRKSLKADFLQAAAIIKDFNVAAFYDVILDNPFENEQDYFDTIQTLIEAPKPFYPQFFSLSLYLGTQLYEKAKKECPGEMENYLKKDYCITHKKVINDMVMIATFLSKRQMDNIIYLYKRDPEGVELKITLFLAKILCLFILKPIVYFQVIKLAQGNSYGNLVKKLPKLLKDGIEHIKQFKITGDDSE